MNRIKTGRTYIYQKAHAKNYEEFRELHLKGIPAYLIEYDRKKAYEYSYLAQKDSGNDDQNSLYLAAFFRSSIGGTGIRDDTTFFQYLKLAFLYGDAEALFDLGYFYGTGKGPVKSMEFATDMFRQSADLGFLPSWYELGLINFYGLLKTKDRKLAQDYFQRSWVVGEPDAKAYCAYIDLLADKDAAKALADLRQAAKDHSPFANFALYQLYNYGYLAGITKQQANEFKKNGALYDRNGIAYANDLSLEIKNFAENGKVLKKTKKVTYLPLVNNTQVFTFADSGDDDDDE